ncbi:unnamed protein product [Phaeothamnion confervicola]
MRARRVCALLPLFGSGEAFHTNGASPRGLAGNTPSTALHIAFQHPGAPSASRALAMSFPKGHKPFIDQETVLPRLYVYDHCPFCVRARMIFGLKNLRHELFFLANDEVDIPTSLIGKKAVPILELCRPGHPDHEQVMKESLDIVKRVDLDPAFGPPVLAGESPARGDLEEWMSRNADVMRRLTRPRNARSSILPEFQFKSAREAFVRNHPIAPPADYEENLANTPALKAQLEAALLELEPLIHGPDAVTGPDAITSPGGGGGGVSYDDISFFARMRSVTIVRDLEIPPRLRAYLDAMSERCDIPLYDLIAI